MAADKDRLMVLVIEGTRRVEQSLSKEVWIGSSSHCFERTELGQ